MLNDYNVLGVLFLYFLKSKSNYKMSLYKFSLAVGISLSGVLSGAVFAQEIPNQVMPGTLDKRFEKKQEALSTDKVIVPKPGQQMAPDLAEQTTFTLRSVSLSGNSVFSSSELSAFYQEYVGEQVSLATMFAVANAITNHYAKAGYALSLAYLPAQEIDSAGRLRLLVVEGSVDEILYNGDVDALSDRVKRQIEKIKAESPLTVATMERYLLLANDTPGLTVTTTLARADEGAGKIKLLVDVKHTALKGFAGVSNRGSKALGPLMGDVGIVYNKLGPLDGHGQSYP